MEEKLKRKAIRKDMSSVGWALLIYNLLMYGFAILMVTIDSIRIKLMELQGAIFTEDQVQAIMTGNGWGYLLTIAVGLLLLRLWQGKGFFKEQLLVRGEPLGFGDFLCLLALMFSCQAFFGAYASMLENFLNQFGLTAMGDLEAATMKADTFSMFLYAGIGAPIAEEILFRGVVMRKLEKYGKGFAIVMSAFLFGVFHGNMVQTPYAFVAGLVFGYTAMNFNILWAMVLHMINNLILADLLTRLTQNMPMDFANGIIGTIIMGSAVAAMLILVIRRNEIAQYRRANRISGRACGYFFTSPGILVLITTILITMIGNLLVQSGL